MKIPIFVASILAATSSAAPLARRSVAFTNDEYAGAVGTPLTITWAGNSGAVTINLKAGEADNLRTIDTVASGVWGSTATWTPSISGTYALEIIDESGAVNYSPAFWVGSQLERRKDTELELKLKELATKENLITIPDWKKALRAPVTKLAELACWPYTTAQVEKAACWPHTKARITQAAKWPFGSGNANLKTEGGDTPAKEPEVPVVQPTVATDSTTSEGAPTFIQGDGWKNDNFRHGTWTSTSKDGKKDPRSEAE